MIQDPMNPSVVLSRAQLLEGAVETTWPRIQPHLGHPLSERLNLTTEKCAQEVHDYQPLLSQLLDDLAQGLQLAEVLLHHPVPPGR
jgi:hypothetical protein